MDPNEVLSLTIPLAGVPATGLYTPPKNITGYNTQTGENLDPPYNETLIGLSADNIVGTSTNPYLPAILPVYIPTLYTNVYSIQTNLVNDLITVSYQDDRRYPNAKAVKDYVASQISGFENLPGNLTGNLLPVSTSLTTTLLAATTQPTIVQNEDTSITSNHIYKMTAIDNARNGAGKMIICNMPLSREATMSLQADTNVVFAVLGKYYKYYQFAIQGDMIDMVQFINTSTSPSTHTFIVKTYGGQFSGPV